MTAPIAIVPARAEHRALILDSFWREYRESPHAKGVPGAVLSRKMQALLESPSWRALVATPEDETSEVLGYLVFRDQRTAAWLHVIRGWRKRGVARALLAHAGVWPGVIACAFITPEVAKLAATKGYTLRFRPYLPDVAQDEAVRLAADLIAGDS